MRRFHAPSAAVLVVSPAIRDELAARGFRNLVPWSRGVDIAAFRPQPREEFKEPRPIWLYAGRVAIEKNIKAFLDLDLPGSKWVVGGGPQLRSLQKRYPGVHFFGSVDTEELSYRYAQADCFVFPSLTDTFGLVMVEALASGVPVAGYPVPGPLDVVTDPKVGASIRPADRLPRRVARCGGLPPSCRDLHLGAMCPAVPRDAAAIPREHWQPLRRRVVPDAAAS